MRKLSIVEVEVAIGSPIRAASSGARRLSRRMLCSSSARNCSSIFNRLSSEPRIGTFRPCPVLSPAVMPRI
ncbi:hypothetical protein KPSA3_07408 [Pseudomonas syringae pv. actinidiae]|uniref:Uncharacterized protein n=1 Tax=Pseudomonas syringae pv. actinidiae TaxID=103796 RepID=A0AAN4TQI6_PSESF|nr:hypothetical protein KPSA3_07408 [Pseudomonas syringae pv. actinidiae]